MTNRQYSGPICYLIVAGDLLPIGKPLSKPKAGWVGDIIPIAQVIPNTAGPIRAYDIGEFCRLVGISPATFHRLVKAGRLIARKIDGKTVVIFEDALAFIQKLPRVPSENMELVSLFPLDVEGEKL